MDSAAAGYGGLNPETGAAKTIGDITKMWIAFVITPVGGTTSTTVYAQVLDTGTGGTASVPPLPPTRQRPRAPTRCSPSWWPARRVAPTSYYTAPDAEPATLTFAPSSGEFATGGGWMTDPATSSRLLRPRRPLRQRRQGPGSVRLRLERHLQRCAGLLHHHKQLLLGAELLRQHLPLDATLSGTATLQVNKASNLALLYGPETKLPLTVTAYDTGKSTGVGPTNSLDAHRQQGVLPDRRLEELLGRAAGWRQHRDPPEVGGRRRVNDQRQCDDSGERGLPAVVGDSLHLSST